MWQLHENPPVRFANVKTNYQNVLRLSTGFGDIRHIAERPTDSQLHICCQRATYTVMVHLQRNITEIFSCSQGAAPVTHPGAADVCEPNFSPLQYHWWASTILVLVPSLYRITVVCACSSYFTKECHRYVNQAGTTWSCNILKYLSLSTLRKYQNKNTEVTMRRVGKPHFLRFHSSSVSH